jgi:hypothetical protein
MQHFSYKTEKKRLKPEIARPEEKKTLVERDLKGM